MTDIKPLSISVSKTSAKKTILMGKTQKKAFLKSVNLQIKKLIRKISETLAIIIKSSNMKKVNKSIMTLKSKTMDSDRLKKTNSSLLIGPVRAIIQAKTKSGIQI